MMNASVEDYHFSFTLTGQLRCCCAEQTNKTYQSELAKARASCSAADLRCGVDDGSSSSKTFASIGRIVSHCFDGMLAAKPHTLDINGVSQVEDGFWRVLCVIVWAWRSAFESLSTL